MNFSRVLAFGLAFGLTVLAGWSPIAAQPVELRGVVRDSASGAPIASAVVMALDAKGDAIARAVSRENGQFRLVRPSAAQRLHVVRLGFRPATIPLSAFSAARASETIDIALVSVPRALQSVDVVAARGCPVRADRNEALALLDQARAGLLATVVARERQPAQMRVIRYDRRLDLDGIEVVRQIVRVDSSAIATTSFNAARNAVDFINQGFRTGRPNQYTFFGPDADVLLDERFQRGYCFNIAPRDTARPRQMGLHFAAVGRRTGRVDIDGTLWIDTVALALHDIEFRYVGVEELAAGLGVGGRVGFRTLPNGVPVIDRWSMKLVGAPDSLVGAVQTQSYSVREIGGELAQVRWTDEQLWTAPLSSVHVTAVSSSGAPAINARLNLEGTDYRAVTDSFGRANIDHVLPGPYSVVVDDPRVQSIGLQLPTTRSFIAQRTSATLIRVEVPTAEEYVASACGRADAAPDDAWLLARVVNNDGQPAIGAKWRLSVSDGASWRVASSGGITGGTGLLQACRGLRRGTSVELAAWHDPADAMRVRRTLNDRLTIIRVPLPSVISVANARPSAQEGRLVSGLITDSVTGTPVADARVTFLGTPFEGASDATGRFTVGGIARGAYTVEVSTPWLDSIGAVTRRMVAISDTTSQLRLFAPNLNEILSATCGAEDVDGVIVGRISTRTGIDRPDGLRVVAEWSTDSTTDVKSRVQRLGWTRTPVEPGGTFRLCGVPMAKRVVLRTEADSAGKLMALPVEMQVAADRRFARADLVLDSAVVILPTLVGTVMADTTGTPIENAEITLTDLGRSVMSDRRGAFRMTEIPVGPHLLSVRRVGYSPMTTSMSFDANRTIEQKVLLPRTTTLASIDVTATTGITAAFEERRQLGVGRFLSAAELVGQEQRKLSDVLTRFPGFSSVTAHGGHAWLYGKRAPGHIAGRNTTSAQAFDNLRNQGVYCPTSTEAAQGIECACYSQIYLDDRLLNPGRPTEPFDLNTLPVAEIAGIELYAGVAETPGRYSNLNAVCGVVLVWTRRR